MEAINVSGDGESSMGQISPGPYPNFNYILSGNAPEPYTLESFIDYLSENHCIELLDFLSDTKTYIDAHRASAPDISPTKMTSDSRRLGKQWKILMSTYIMPGAPDELNIPESLRATLLDHTNVMISPPKPSALDPAMRHAYELLTQSALLPFIQRIRASGNHNNRNNRNNRNNLNNRNNSLSPSPEAHSNSQRNLRAISGASSNRNSRYVRNISPWQNFDRVHDDFIDS